MAELVTIEGHPIYLAEPVEPPPCDFVGRQRELMLCKAAWGVDRENKLVLDGREPMHFRLGATRGRKE